MVTGLLQLALATAILAAMVGLLLQLPTLLDRVEAYRRRRRERDRLHPTHPPLDRVAADLRRLGALARHPAVGEPMTRRRAAWAAYDDALLDACRALAIPDTLSMLPEGTERDAERLRVEYLLEQAGVVLRDRRDDHDDAA